MLAQKKEEEEAAAWGEDPNQQYGYGAMPVEMMWEYTTSPPSVNVCKGGVTNSEEVTQRSDGWIDG